MKSYKKIINQNVKSCSSLNSVGSARKLSKRNIHDPGETFAEASIPSHDIKDEYDVQKLLQIIEQL